MSVSTAAQPAFDPANFEKGQPIDNPYLPWKPGTTFVYHTYLPGNVLEQIDTVTVTDKTRRIDGVTCTVVSDVVTDPKTGQLIENTKDYYAQDKSGSDPACERIWISFRPTARPRSDQGRTAIDERMRRGCVGIKATGADKGADKWITKPWIA